MQVEVNHIVYLRVKALGVSGNTLNATIYDSLGNVFASKQMTRLNTSNLFQASQVFTQTGSYYIKTDDFEYYSSIEVDDKKSRIINILEGDEEITPTSFIKKEKGTNTVLIQKTVSNDELGNITITEN